MTTPGRSILGRRDAMRILGGLTVGAAGFIVAGCASPAVKWSTGTSHPRLTVPANATDCHHHIFDARYPVAPNAASNAGPPSDALVSDYQGLQRRLGTTRDVIVQPLAYGVDNRLLVESIATIGPAKARGIAVVNTEVTDSELTQLHQGGVRGIRIFLPNPGITTMDMVRPLAERIAGMGWHIEVQVPAAASLAAKDIWSSLPCPIVFDHLGRIPQPGATAHPLFAMIRELVQQDKAWVKLSGFYLDSKVGAPTYADSVLVASMYAKEAPERMLWASDWPHPALPETNKPDDALLLDLLSECVPSQADRDRILVDNPASLYQFG